MKFWMVVCADIDGTNFNLLERRGPRYMHDSREDAEREAERLAVANPASDFAVLEVVAIVTATNPHAKPGDLVAGNVPRWNREPRPWCGVIPQPDSKTNSASTDV